MDENDLELTKRRLIDEVRDTVQKQLFRTYALIGAAVIAAFGYANWDFVDDTKAEVRAKAAEAVNLAVASAQSKIDSLKEDVASQTGRIEYERERAAKVHSQVADQLRLLDVEANNLTSLNESVAALSDARRQLETGIADIKARTDNLSVMAEELKRIAAKLQVSDKGNAAAYGDVIKTLDSAQQKVQDLAARPTVYLQFAGGARALAQELAAKLAAVGFLMPGEERHAGAAGKRDVRYYYPEDRPGADALASGATAALIEMGYSAVPPIKVDDLSSYGGTKTKPGVLELWVEL